MTHDPIERAILYLADLCDGARRRDGHGFNRYDADIGNSLARQAGRWSPAQREIAERIARRYRRQVADGLGIDIGADQPAAALSGAAAILGPGGRIATLLPGYEARQGQLEMAAAVEDAIAGQEHIVVEAGTGTGKSLGYLVPVALTGKQAIISTASKALQGQLAGKDAPFLASALPSGLDVATLKGRQNYLCLARYDDLKGVFIPGMTLTIDEERAFGDIQRWREETESGDFEGTDFPIPPTLQQRLTVSADECMGRRCPFHGQCFVEHAKQRAKEAKVVIVNHALLLRDAALRELTGGNAHILPSAAVAVIDEAHQLEEMAVNALGIELTVWRWRRIRDRYRELTVGMTERPELATSIDERRHAERMLSRAESIGDAVEQCIAEIEQRLFSANIQTLKLGAEPSFAIVAELLKGFAEQFTESPPSWMLTMDEGKDKAKALGGWAALARTTGRLAQDFAALATGDDTNILRYAQLEGAEGRKHVKIYAKFIDVAPHLRRLVYTRRIETVTVVNDYGERVQEERVIGYETVVNTSATLATTTGFTHWRRQVGLDNADELIVASPFDYEHHALLYLPADGKAFDPSQDFRSGGTSSYFSLLCGEIEALVRASNGRAFLLFASGGMMRRVYEAIHNRLPYTKLIQGELPKPELVRRFKADGHAVLFGLKSFWEGVDVQGDALSLVVIDKLPFGVPDDPLWAARCEAIDRRGGRWFADLALPQATIALKQAAGRLIRTQSDRGVVAVLDGRLLTKSYGRQILAALPPMPQTHSLAAVTSFFRTGVAA